MSRAYNEPWNQEGALLLAGGAPVMDAQMGDIPESTAEAYARRALIAVNALAGVPTKDLAEVPCGHAAQWMRVWLALPPEAFDHRNGPAAWVAGMVEELRRTRANAIAYTRIYRLLSPPSTAGNGGDDAIAEIKRLQALVHPHSAAPALRDQYHDTRAGAAQPAST